MTFEPRHENKTCSACREWLNERLKECESEKEWEWDSEREWEWESVRVSFEHRDENKSCSACQEWLNERLNECESEKEWDSESVIWFPAFVWRSDIFLVSTALSSAAFVIKLDNWEGWKENLTFEKEIQNKNKENNGKQQRNVEQSAFDRKTIANFSNSYKS